MMKVGLLSGNMIRLGFTHSRASGTYG